MRTDKLLVANLSKKETFSELGRIFFSVLNAFSDSGYKILLLENEMIHKASKYGNLTFSLNNLSIIDKKPKTPDNYIYLYDHKDKQFNNMPWGKQINLKYDIFSNYWFDQPIIMPFPVHPLQTPHINIQNLSKLQSNKRQFQILFAGDVNGYKKRWVNYPKEKLTRSEIIEIIKEKLFKKVVVVDNEKSFTATMDTNFIDNIILIDNEHQRLDSEIWLETLAKAHFFLGPPGIVMSMCHNLVEAMAVGCIPITNYPEWFHPNLENGINCIVFDDKKDLVDQINSVFSIDRAKINSMKKNAIEYYEKYLKTETFVKKVEENPNEKITILYYTERYVAQNQNKLNKYSVLMRDTSVPLKKSGIRHQIMTLMGRL